MTHSRYEHDVGWRGVSRGGIEKLVAEWEP